MRFKYLGLSIWSTFSPLKLCCGWLRDRVSNISESHIQIRHDRPGADAQEAPGTQMIFNKCLPVLLLQSQIHAQQNSASYTFSIEQTSIIKNVCSNSRKDEKRINDHRTGDTHQYTVSLHCVNQPCLESGIR